MREALGFLPVFLIGVVLVLALQPSDFKADESRYVRLATNLTQGFFAPPDTLELVSGPGYPLILAPFVMTATPLVFARLLNALLFTLAAVHFFYTLRLYSTRPRLAWSLTYLLGIYLIVYGVRLELLMTETLAVFLVAAFSFHFCRLNRTPPRIRDGVLASFFLGWLALTKVFFGYVILTALVISAALLLVSRTRRYLVTLVVFAGSLLVCTPYLGYTYSLTGRPLYWSNVGGLSVYWMAALDEHSYGDWFSFSAVLDNPERFEGHHELFSRLSNLDFVERNDEFWRIAADNRRTHPEKFLRNWRANINRMVFNYPFSRPKASTGNMAFVYSVLFYLVVFSVYPAIVGRRAIPHEIWVLLGLALTALVGVSLHYAYPRYLVPLVPLFALWLSVVLPLTVRIRLLRMKSGHQGAP